MELRRRPVRASRDVRDGAREGGDLPLGVLDGGAQVANGALGAGDSIFLAVRLLIAPGKARRAGKHSRRQELSISTGTAKTGILLKMLYIVPQ